MYFYLTYTNYYSIKICFLIIMNNSDLKLWPFDEALKIKKRVELQKSKKDLCIFQTGYGPSGLPHIGTFGEVLRTIMVAKALKSISSLKTRLYVFSDDMDGLRKVPENIPEKEMIKKNLYKSLSSVPDPFKKFNSFSEHNNFKLQQFLNRFNFDYHFKSATNLYKSGFFNEGLSDVLFNYEKIKNVILPTLGKERRETYSPFLPVCSQTGQVLQVKIEEIDLKNSKVAYFNPHQNKIVENSIHNGDCKLQWKVDWAMRWKVLEVDYEMNGKDLIESFQLSSKINKIIGGRPPVNLTYELFLDHNGEKISKSIGNGISVDDWLDFAPQESLELFMFQSPRKAKRLYFDSIPKSTDEFIKYKNQYLNQNEDERKNNPTWFINLKDKEMIPENLTFNMILNLASVCNAENPDILWGFIESYYPNIKKKKTKFLNQLLELGVNYYKKFVLPNKKYRPPHDKEVRGFKLIIKMLKKIDPKSSGEEIQSKIYEIGMSLDYEKLREWFSGFYEVILGQKEGPRIGSFIKLYGINKTIILLKEKIGE